MVRLPQVVAKCWLGVLGIGLMAVGGVDSATAQMLDKRRLLEAQTFWDNRDWDWYVASIPAFECPDADVTTTYYYRWELLTKHLTYGSPNTGYVFTEFIDRPFWSGTYGAISCPAGHQLYEARWLLRSDIAQSYLRYWFRTPGAQPRNYSTWLADSAWAVDQVHPDRDFLIALLPDLVAHYAAWEQRHFVPEVGLFWQTGHDDGMEFNINSRQTRDILRGAPGFRPSFNAYMWADARAIARIAAVAGDAETAQRFTDKAAALRERVQRLLWDPQRQFFFPMIRDDEERDGHRIQARTLTYQSGRFAGDPHGRELIGYVPWQFDLPEPDRGYELAWKKLFDPEAFAAPFGPTTVERHDPQFLLQKTCCWWSGQSWPYATTQTLKGLANVLQGRTQSVVTKADYFDLLRTYARTHRKGGRPYLAEACHPDTGSFEGHDGYNHSEHYFHSGYCDLILTGLVGIRPGTSTEFEIHPLAPEEWDWFAVDDVPYQGRRLAVVWDRDGSRYGQRPGLTVLANGKVVAHSPQLARLAVSLPPVLHAPSEPLQETGVNFAVNNDGTYYPRFTASYTAPRTSLSKLHDGNYWYELHPPNRWTCEGSPQASDWVICDLGTPRPVEAVWLYLLDDTEPSSTVRVPERIELESWDEGNWRPVALPAEQATRLVGHRATRLSFPRLTTSRLRLTLHHRGTSRAGLSEFEVWGPAQLPLPAVPPPPGNLAYNPGDRPYPRASASHTSRFDRVATVNDGVTNFLPTPANRWTSYESHETSDWLEIEWEREIEFRRVELAIYDDRGGVQTPASYEIQYLAGDQWRAVVESQRRPAQPVGGQWNEVRFAPVQSRKLRVVFQHRGPARSGLSEILVWNE
ncbi:MAG: discoidin domain-containing protein [Pirellulales bacterium]